MEGSGPISNLNNIVPFQLSILNNLHSFGQNLNIASENNQNVRRAQLTYDNNTFDKNKFLKQHYSNT